jgi:hypothetical protein
MTNEIPLEKTYPIRVLLYNADNPLPRLTLKPRADLIRIKNCLYEYEDNLLFRRHSFDIADVGLDFSYTNAERRQQNIFITKNVFEILYLLAKESIVYRYSSDDVFNINFEITETGEISSILISHKFVVDDIEDVNHANTMKLLTEQFLVAKRQMHLLSGDPLIANSGELRDTNFFILPLV